MSETTDEVAMVAELLDEGGPSPQEVADGREGLMRMAWPERRRRRHAWRPVGIGAGLVAVAAATAVAIATVGSGGSAPPDRPRAGSGTEPVLDGEQMVLAAAYQAERRVQGRYLTVHSQTCFAKRIRATTGDYTVQPCDEMWKWQARDRANQSAIWSRDLPTAPQTPKDVALWKKNGSPKTFAHDPKLKDLQDLYKTKASPWKEDPTDRNEASGKFFVSGLGREFSAKELQNLPTDPKSLRKIFLPRDGKSEASITGAGQDIVRIGLALQDVPLPPKVWAGVIRLLTTTPGVRAIGEVTDPAGRRGVALEGIRTSLSRGKASSAERIIFDRKSGEMLALVSTSTTVVKDTVGGSFPPGTMTGYFMVVKKEWTDSRPAGPLGRP